MRGFQRLELAHQRVELRIRDLGIVQRVVAVVVVGDLLAQRFHPRLHLLRRAHGLIELETLKLRGTAASPRSFAMESGERSWETSVP